MLRLSDDQIQDLMFVRQVAYLKNHMLSCQGEAVAAKILEDSPTPVVNVNKLSTSAIQLQQQALDEHDVVHRVKWAIHCGVCLDSLNCLGLSWGACCVRCRIILVLCIPMIHRLCCFSWGCITQQSRHSLLLVLLDMPVVEAFYHTFMSFVERSASNSVFWVTFLPKLLALAL